MKTFEEFVNEASDTLAAHYKDSSGNISNIFYSKKLNKVWVTSKDGSNLSPSNLMFKHNGNTDDLRHEFIEGIKIAEPSTERELAKEVGLITDLGNKIKAGKG